MRSIVLVTILTAAFGSPTLLAEPALPAAKLQTLKKGTLFVRTRSPQMMGTAFVVAVKNNVAFAVTNAHVVGPLRQGTAASVELVLYAGTAGAQSVSAKLAAVDELADLAILSFSVDKPPRPLPFVKSEDVPETTPVFVLGFPFGEGLAQPNATPAVTVSRASVSAKQRSQEGVIDRLQLDGELNPGNSGGPIVTSQGEVLGVALAKVSGTNISFGVSIGQVADDLRGRVAGITIDAGPHDEKFLVLGATVRLIDPLGKISTVGVVTGPKAKNEDTGLGGRGHYKRLLDGRTHKLEIKGDTATGKIKLKKTIAASQAGLFQVRLTYDDGKSTYTVANPLPVEEAAKVSSKGGSGSGPPATGSPEPAEDFGGPPAALESEKTTKLPAEVEDLAVAGGGRYLVMRLRDTPALTVFDTFKGEIVKHIRLPSTDFLFAAGGNTAVVYLREENLLQSYDLATFERRKTKPNPFGPVITNLVMGHSRGGRAFVRHSVGTGQLSPAFVSLLDTSKLEPVTPPNRVGQGMIPLKEDSPRNALRLRANRDLSLVTDSGASGSPSGVGLFVWRRDTCEFRHQDDSGGSLAIGDDGRIYTQTGTIYNDRLEKVGAISGMTLVPALGGMFYVSFAQDGKMMLYEAGKTRPLGPLEEFPDWKRPGNPGDRRDRDLSFDQRVIFDPVHGRTAFISQENTSIILRPFDLRAALEASGVDYLVVTSMPSKPATPKKKWSYQVEAISKAGGVTYSLELAPEGMAVNASGLVTWTPKKPLSPDGEKVIVLVKDSSGEETFHTFVIAAGSTKD